MRGWLERLAHPERWAAAALVLRPGADGDELLLIRRVARPDDPWADEVALVGEAAEARWVPVARLFDPAAVGHQWRLVRGRPPWRARERTVDDLRVRGRTGPVLDRWVAGR